MAIVVASLLLSSCVSTTSVPSGAELDEVRAAQLDAQWANLDLPDERRPVDTGFEVVAIEDWAHQVASCMKSAGYTNFEDRGGTLQIGKSDPISEPVSESIDFFECRSAYQRDLTLGTALTRDQRDFLYDYYQQSLVPCLELAGVRVDDAPTREWFAQTGEGMGWNPYYAMDTFSFGEVVADDELLATCPSFPKGEIFDPWRVSDDG